MVLIGLVVALLLSFYLMGKVCDEYFVESLDKIAKRFNMSQDAAGATLMAVGSSAPELFIAIIALIRPGAHEAIGMGTIVGSAIFNVLVIVGAVAVVRKTFFPWQPVVRDVAFYAISIILLIFTFRDGQIELYEAVIFVVIYVVYVLAVVKWRKFLPYDETKYIEEVPEEELPEPKKWWEPIMRPFDWFLSKLFPSEERYFFVFLISIVLIAVLSWAIVESAIEISHILNIPEAVIALTVLAVGTSVPDLISSVIVSKEGRGGMGISNAFGSNIFDILVGLGLPWLFMMLISNEKIYVESDSLVISTIILFGTVIIVFGLFAIRKWRIGKGAGIFFISIYILYVIWELLKLYVLKI